MENFSRGTIFGTENFLKIDAEENAEWKMNFIPFADLWLADLIIRIRSKWFPFG